MKKIIALLIFCCAGVQGEEIANYQNQSGKYTNSSVIDLTQGDFDRTIQSSNVPVVVDINAKWCGACKMVSPVIDQLNQQYAGKVLFAKIDADTQPSFIQRFEVSGLPTILFFKPGNTNPVYKHTGYFAKEEFAAKINETLLQ